MYNIFLLFPIHFLGEKLKGTATDGAFYVIEILPSGTCIFYPLPNYSSANQCSYQLQVSITLTQGGLAFNFYTPL